MTTIGPHILNLILKKVKKCIELTFYEKAIAELDIIDKRPLDPTFFSPEVAEAVKNKLWRAQLILVLECPGEALELLADVRLVLDGIFIRTLWISDRLLKPDGDVGDLGKLPYDIRFKIFQDLIGSL
jgi:hypothetical protein